MLWLCLYLPRLPAEALGLRDAREVVVAQRGASRWLSCDSGRLAAGTPLATALSLNAELRALPRRPKAEQAMLLALAHGLYRYGSPVHAELRELDEVGALPQALIWLEIGASLRLFGGWPTLRAQVQALLAEQQHEAQLAVAPTRAAAALLASRGEPAYLPTQEALLAALASLPVSSLYWPHSEIEVLHSLGLRRLAQLFALPRAAFARRFGPERLRQLDQLRGLAAEPAQALLPPTQFRRRFELLGETAQVEGLLFALRRLCLELQAWLRARDTGLLALRLSCEHAQRRRSLQLLRLASAHRDGERLFTLLRERLMREPLPAPVRALELRSLELAEPVAIAHDLFDTQAQAQQNFQATLERVAARLGESAVWQPALQADHRPDRACQGERAGAVNAGDLPPRPLWLLARPLPLPGTPQLEPDFERIESGWWDGADQRRDYHSAEWQNARVWVYRPRDGEDARWYLQGLWG
ncbi:protein ImuB [Solimonas aquatica]|uniref:Protein ImuB n=1 Tax=Solimonas aquatica TaxID=489703 RepID=A0A1H9EXE0_9GAMM|nr:DNA polymerase Y family protein [Solimonas aquatica]SEQ30436.1 protein ImuB [Solimonas aquatica]